MEVTEENMHRLAEVLTKTLSGDVNERRPGRIFIYFQYISV